MRQHPHANRSSKSVRVSSPITWKSDDPRKLRNKQRFVEEMSLAQIKAILNELTLSVDDQYTYENCVQSLVLSQWMPSREAIQSYQRQRAKPVRTAAQKQEDRVRLCTVHDITKLSCAEMKLWLQRNGGRAPDGSSETDRENMKRTIRNQMRLTTPIVKRRRAPKRPKKAKNVGRSRRSPFEERISDLKSPPLHQSSTESISTKMSIAAQTLFESPARSAKSPTPRMSSSKKRRLRRRRDRQFFDYKTQSLTAHTEQQNTTPQRPNKEMNGGFMSHLSELSPTPRYRRSSACVPDTDSPETPISQSLFETPIRSAKTLLFGTPSLSPWTDEQTFADETSAAAANDDMDNVSESDGGDGDAFLASLVDLIDL